MIRVRARGALLFVTLALLLAGCTRERSEDPRPLVAVSVVPQRAIVEALAGDRVRTLVMVPPGASPVAWEPTLQQMVDLEHAALYVKVGHRSFPFEAAWLDRLLDERPSLRVVDASEGLARETEGGDPHLWVVPRHVVHMAERIEPALEALLPGEAPALRENLAALRAHAEAVDAELRARLAPFAGRAFLVFHPAWGHFADEYGLRQIAVQHEHKDPGPRELQHLIAEARAADVDVVFVQPQFDRSAAQAVAREVGARVEVLDPLAADWDENLLRAAAALVEAFEAAGAAPAQDASVRRSWAPTRRSWIGTSIGHAPVHGALQPAHTDASRSRAA